jgi:hypothetical protein
MVYPLPLQTLQVLAFEETVEEDDGEEEGEGGKRPHDYDRYAFDAKELRFLLHDSAVTRAQENLDRAKSSADGVRRRLQREEAEYVTVAAGVGSCSVMAGRGANERAVDMKQGAASLKASEVSAVQGKGDRAEGEVPYPNTRPFAKSNASSNTRGRVTRTTRERIDAVEMERGLLIQANRGREQRLKALLARVVCSRKEAAAKEEEYAAALQKCRDVVAHGRDKGSIDAERLIQRWHGARERERAAKTQAKKQAKQVQGEGVGRQAKEVDQKEARELWRTHDRSSSKQREQEQPVATGTRLVTRFVGKCSIQADYSSDFSHVDGNMWYGFESGGQLDVQGGATGADHSDPACVAVAAVSRSHGRGVCIGVGTSTRLLIHILNGTNLDAVPKHLGSNAHRARLFCKVYVDEKYVGRTPFNQLRPSQLDQVPLRPARAIAPTTQAEGLALIKDEDDRTEPVAVGYSGARSVGRQQRRRQWERRYQHQSPGGCASAGSRKSAREPLHPEDSAHHPVWNSVLEVPLYMPADAPSAACDTTATAMSGDGEDGDNVEDAHTQEGGKDTGHTTQNTEKKQGGCAHHVRVELYGWQKTCHAVDDTDNSDDHRDPDAALSRQQSELGRSLIFVGRSTGAETKLWERLCSNPETDRAAITVAVAKKVEHELFVVVSTSTMAALGRWQQQLQLHADSLQKWQRCSISTLTWQRQRAKHLLAGKDWARAFAGFTKLCHELELDGMVGASGTNTIAPAMESGGAVGKVATSKEEEDRDKELVGEEHYIGQVQIRWPDGGRGGTADASHTAVGGNVSTHHARQYLRRHYRKHELVAGHSATGNTSAHSQDPRRHQQQPTQCSQRRKDGPPTGGQLGVALSTGAT